MSSALAGQRRIAVKASFRASVAIPALLWSGLVRAQDVFVSGGSAGSAIDPTSVAQIALFVGTVLGGSFFAYRSMQERRRLSDETVALRGRIADISRENGRLTTLADARDRRIVMWSNDDEDGRPALFGDLPAETGAPPDRATFLGFGRWLRPHSAGLLEHAVAELREDGTPFDLTVETASGVPIEVEGRTGAQGRFVRFLPTHTSRRAESDLRARAERLQAQLDRVEALTAEIAHPAWTRDGEGRLDGANLAYARAKGLDKAEQAVEAGAELFGEIARGTIAESLAGSSGTFSGRLSTTVEGERHVFQVQEVRTPVGSAGVAVDVTVADEAEQTLARTRRAHAEALDNLATAVAAFDRDEKLVHWNGAFERMWELDRAFLETSPSNALLLDRLRADGKLAETPRWREWVQKTLEVYGASEPVEDEWTPPDGRTIHVVAAPQEGGGVTWLFENMTERHALSAKVKESQRLRDASIEHLEEGIAVFGSDGRLRLANPAFARLWDLDEARREPGTHVSALAAACGEAFETPSRVWVDLVEDVTTFSDKRETRQGNVRLRGDRTLAWTSQPLPRGETMLTFVDMSDTVRYADALEARNEAMERADRLKSAFLGHVSYELRSPLTSIIGFTDLLVAGAAGSVTERQAEYIGYIGSSSKDLMRTVDQIIDLSAIDAGEMRLDRAEVGIDALVAKVVDAIEPSLDEHDLVLEVEGLDEELGAIDADGERLAQVLHNLLVNAVEHTRDGGTITLSVTRNEPVGEVRFTVADEGDGIPESLVPKVFEPFVHHKGNGRNRGAGLGLSTVKAFVELHGGRVDLSSSPDGTVVTCHVPVSAPEEPTGDSKTPVLRAEPVTDRITGGQSQGTLPADRSNAQAPHVGSRSLQA